MLLISEAWTSSKNEGFNVLEQKKSNQGRRDWQCLRELHAHVHPNNQSKTNGAETRNQRVQHARPVIWTARRASNSTHQSHFKEPKSSLIEQEASGKYSDAIFNFGNRIIGWTESFWDQYLLCHQSKNNLRPLASESSVEFSLSLLNGWCQKQQQQKWSRHGTSIWLKAEIISSTLASDKSVWQLGQYFDG